MATTYTKRTQPTASVWKENQSPGQRAKFGKVAFGSAFFGTRPVTSFTERTEPTTNFTERTEP